MLAADQAQGEMLKSTGKEEYKNAPVGVVLRCVPFVGVELLVVVAVVAAESLASSFVSIRASADELNVPALVQIVNTFLIFSCRSTIVSTGSLHFQKPPARSTLEPLCPPTAATDCPCRAYSMLPVPVLPTVDDELAEHQFELAEERCASTRCVFSTRRARRLRLALLLGSTPRFTRDGVDEVE